MPVTERDQIIRDIRLKDYLFGKESIFRHYQNLLLERYGKELNGNVVELGGYRGHNYARYFPNASSYSCTNIGGEYDEYVDITSMPYADGSQDGYVCISVLEHVFDIHKALDEIDRTLKIGGSLLLAVPFCFPHHGEKDYYRLAESFYSDRFRNYDIKAFVHLGGTVSSVVDILQRPKGHFRKRYALYKIAGFFILLALKHFETVDRFPAGYGLLAVKREDRQPEQALSVAETIPEMALTS